MTKYKYIIKLLAAALAAVLVMTLSAVSVFADDTDADTIAVTDTEAESESKSESDTVADSDDADDNGADTDSESDTDAAGDNDSGEDEGKKDSGKVKKDSKGGFITLIIIAVCVVAFAAWALRDRERSSKMWRSFKSEFKKISWAKHHDAVKKTIMVIIAIIIFAAIFGIVDYLLSQGIIALGRLF
ncbi:MAG: preprotein translocase subunit SecE [Eubacteriales bacterium]|jgi:preprotein translocase SecE subunit|nr:preprotein translocase subunit SecE [Clostridiales bacterium]